MREMKDSGIEWIGEIPKSWTVTILSALFSERKCKNSGLTENNLLSLSYGNIVRKDIESNEGLLPASFETYNIIEPGNIVFRLTDLQNDKRSLRTGLCQERGIITSAYVTLQIRSDDSPRYMHYLFHTYDLCKVFYGMGDGVRQGMNYEDLKRLRILRPDQGTQRRIADYLDRKCSQIDAIIARQQEVIEKLKAYKLSVITEAVTKGLVPDVPMKDSGIEWVGEIPEHWVMIKTRYTVKDIGDIDHYMPESVAVGIPYLMTGDLKDFASEVDFDSCKQVTPDDYLKLSKKIKIEKGDLIFARYATIGTVCLVDVDRDFLVSYSCVIVKVDPNLIDTKFLMYYYKSTAFLEEITKYSNSNTQSNIGKESMYRAKVCVPPLNEQEEIIQYLDKICGSIELLLKSKQAVIDKLTEYKKSLIYEVVTGKKGV